MSSCFLFMHMNTKVVYQKLHQKTGLFQHRMKPDTGVSVLGLSYDLIKQQILRILEKLNT